MSANLDRQRGYSPWAEALRFSLLVAAALIVFSPYFTSRIVGGVDARWYAAMLTDFIHQVRGGHFPVLAGEGRYNWMGGIHPYRSAPVFATLGGVWDCLTFGRFSPLVLEHLTVITSAVVGSVGCYLAMASFLPRLRWEAFLLALIYFLTPVWLGLIVATEAYMSYMVFAIMPLVLYGNARSLTHGDRKGYLALGVGLALAWMGHAPIANICTLVSLGLQVGNLVLRPTFPYKLALSCIGWFLALDAFFFTPMSELPPWHEHPALDVMRALGFCAFFVGFAKGVIRREGGIWWVVGGLGLVVSSVMTLPWLLWLALAAVIALSVSYILKRARRTDVPALAVDILLFSLLVAAVPADRIIGYDLFGRNSEALGHFVDSTSDLGAMLRPFKWDMFGRPGLAILVLLVFILAARWFLKATPARLFSAAIVVVIVFTERIPWVSDFIVGYFPRYLASISTMTLTIRVVPPLIGFTVMGACLAIREMETTPLVRRGIILWGLVLLTFGSAVQAAIFVISNRVLTSSAEFSAQSMRTENMPTFRYDYDYLRKPRYLTDGVSDPGLECRLIDASGNILSDSTEAASASEAMGFKRISLVVARGQPNWVQFQPELAVAPGEQLLVRFEFDPKVNYSGWFFMHGIHAYREYALPSSGFQSSFGTTLGSSRVIKVWNTSTATERYHFSYETTPSGRPKDGESFATLIVSKYDTERVPIDLKSLTPFTATVRAASDCYLETCRAFLPGYEARVDGVSVPVSRSNEALVQIPIKKGTHTVVLTLPYTTRNLVGLFVSALAWLALGAVGIRYLRKRPD